MARVGCLCGATLSNVQSPSENLIYVYTMREILDSIHNNPEKRLWDYYEDNLDTNMYWYCQKCGRIYHYPSTEKSPDKIYKRTETQPECKLESNDELVMFTDIEVDEVTEANFEITLEEYMYIRNQSEKWFYDKKRDCIYIVEPQSGKNKCLYEREK